jgi:hypothetical protein
MRVHGIGLFLSASILLTACAERTPARLKVVLPDSFRGFGAMYGSKHPSVDAIGRFEFVGDHATAFVDGTGGVEADTSLASLQARGFRISVFYQSGEELPLHLSNREPTSGTRFWLLPTPISGAEYFFVGTIEEVRAFDTNPMYDTRFVVDAYFRSRKRERREGAP